MNWGFFTSKEFAIGAGSFVVGGAAAFGAVWARAWLFRRALEKVKTNSDFSTEKKLEKLAELFREKNKTLNVDAARYMAAAALALPVDQLMKQIDQLHEAARQVLEEAQRKAKRAGGEAEAA